MAYRKKESLAEPMFRLCYIFFLRGPKARNLDRKYILQLFRGPLPYYWILLYYVQGLQEIHSLRETLKINDVNS